MNVIAAFIRTRILRISFPSATCLSITSDSIHSGTTSESELELKHIRHLRRHRVSNNLPLTGWQIALIVFLFKLLCINIHIVDLKLCAQVLLIHALFAQLLNRRKKRDPARGGNPRARQTTYMYMCDPRSQKNRTPEIPPTKIPHIYALFLRPKQTRTHICGMSEPVCTAT